VTTCRLPHLEPGESFRPEAKSPVGRLGLLVGMGDPRLFTPEQSDEYREPANANQNGAVTP
jgi:hypothetical protein